MTRAVGQKGAAIPIGALEEQRAIVERLDACLAAVQATNGLQRGDLRATERAIRQLGRRSMAPSANEFWETTALPRAQRLIDESRRVIDREVGLLEDHRRRGTGPPEERLSVTRTELLAALPSVHPINDLGRWWQQRLRRAAFYRSIPAILTGVPAEAELIVASHEMTLLDRAPWSHGDRLLSAFELAQGEVGRFAVDRIDELTRPASPGGGQRQLEKLRRAPG